MSERTASERYRREPEFLPIPRASGRANKAFIALLFLSVLGGFAQIFGLLDKAPWTSREGQREVNSQTAEAIRELKAKDTRIDAEHSAIREKFEAEHNVIRADANQTKADVAALRADVAYIRGAVDEIKAEMRRRGRQE